MNRYPAKPMMDEMAKYGRYGDSMLVHMNPVEVAGLASLSPTGQLSTNPVTGQPEAFIPLLFGGLGSLLKLSPLMTGVLTGAGTAAVTGDLKRGILSGLTAGFGAGVGDAMNLGDIGTAAGEVGTTSAEVGAAITDAAQDTGMSLVSDVTSTAIPEPGMLDQIRSSVPDALKAQPEAMTTAIDNLGFTGNLAGAGITSGIMEQDRLQEQFARQEMARLGEAEADRREAYDDLQRGYMAAQPGIPTGLSGARSEMSRRTPPPMYMAEGGDTGKRDVNPYETAYDDYGLARGIARFMGGPRGYMGVDPVTVQQRLRGQDVIAPPKDYMPGFEPEFNYFQSLERDDAGNIISSPSVPDRSYRPMRQGVISRSQYFDPVLQAPQSNAQMNEYRRTLEKLDPGPLDVGSVMGLASEGSVLSPMQQNVLQSVYSAPPPRVMPSDLNVDQSRIDVLMSRGMTYAEALANQRNAINQGYDLNNDGTVTDEEFKQATKGSASGTTVSSPTNTGQTTYTLSTDQIRQMYPNLSAEQVQAIANLGGPDFNPTEFVSMFDSGISFSEGGEIPVRTSMMEGSVPDGGIARIPTEFTQQEGMPSEQEMSMLAMAVLGQTENPDPIINMFVDKYGPEVYRQARKMILESVVPNAQTEGMVRGNGSGMDDMVQGMIGKDQPVAVSPGEYIVAADVVSGLGEGSSDAGAKELDKMMDKVRMERNGTTQQAPRINERKVMPA
jgi:hypothetical protein